MGYYSGNTGSIQFGESANVNGETGWRNSPTKIRNWSLTTTAQLLNTTTLGDYDKTSVGGLRTTTGTMSLFYYAEAASSNVLNNTGSYFIQMLQRSAAESNPEAVQVRLRLYLDDNNYVGAVNQRDYVELDANLTSVSYGSSVGELVSVEVAFEGNGPVLTSRV